MGFWRWILGKHNLTDDDRQKAMEIRDINFQRRKQEAELNAQIQALKLERERLRLSQEIKDLRGDDGDDEMSPMLMGILSTALASRNAAPAAPAAQIEQQPQLIHLEDQDIDNMLKSVPKVALKAAKNMSVEAIDQFVAQKIGKVDQDTLRRIINRVKA